MIRVNINKWIQILTCAIATFCPLICFAAGPVLQDVKLNTLEGNRVRLQFEMSLPVSEPLTFSTNHPNRVVLDFPGVVSKLEREQAKIDFNTGVLKRVSTVSTKDRTRVVLDVNETVPYETRVEGKYVYVTLSQASSSKTTRPANDPFQGQVINKQDEGKHSVRNIDFRRGASQEGLILIDLSDSKVPIDFKEQGSKIIVRFLGTTISEAMQRKLDVTDFGTPIQSINTVQTGKDVEMQVSIDGFSENVAFQADKRFTIEVKPLSKEEKEKQTLEKQQYTGERLSLNFQDIEVRSVLQLIADFTGLNMVASDTVRGNVTLRLKNVPWDQALDIILKTKGLDKRKMGNVLFIGPSEEISAREKLELQTDQQVQDLAPLRTEYIQVNFAKAAELATLLKDEKTSLLSSRGNVSVDERTNILLVQDTANKLDEIRGLVNRLDVPVRQVLIESRVVFAKDNFQEVLGVNFGTAIKMKPGKEPIFGISGNRASSSAIATGTSAPAAITTDNRLNTNLFPSLPAGVARSQFGLSIASLPGGTILDLELQALESEGLAKVVSSPRLMTSNQQTAHIESGKEVPYLEATSSGAASVSFKKAVLRLEVTPQITPNDNIILDLTVNQDDVGTEVFNGVPTIDTKEIHTQVLVSNGETVVLGGIYKQDKNNTVRRVPFLGALPGVGFLFRDKDIKDNREELMIFVTPKIVKDTASS
ncbi:MAG: type IV pilus secretin PilQ [Gammaproteobacteria bacterium]